MRRDHAAGAARAVAQIGRDGELALAADLHSRDALVPAADHLAAPEREDECLAAVLARVELLAVGGPAGVMHADLLAGVGRVSRADNYVLDHQSAGRFNGRHGTLSCE